MSIKKLIAEIVDLEDDDQKTQLIIMANHHQELVTLADTAQTYNINTAQTSTILKSFDIDWTISILKSYQQYIVKYEKKISFSIFKNIFKKHILYNATNLIYFNKYDLETELDQNNNRTF